MKIFPKSAVGKILYIMNKNMYSIMNIYITKGYLNRTFISTYQKYRKFKKYFKYKKLHRKSYFKQYTKLYKQFFWKKVLINKYKISTFFIYNNKVFWKYQNWKFFVSLTRKNI